MTEETATNGFPKCEGCDGRGRVIDRSGVDDRWVKCTRCDGSGSGLLAAPRAEETEITAALALFADKAADPTEGVLRSSAIAVARRAAFEIKGLRAAIAEKATAIDLLTAEVNRLRSEREAICADLGIEPTDDPVEALEARAREDAEAWSEAVGALGTWMSLAGDGTVATAITIVVDMMVEARARGEEAIRERDALARLVVDPSHMPARETLRAEVERLTAAHGYAKKRVEELERFACPSDTEKALRARVAELEDGDRQAWAEVDRLRTALNNRKEEAAEQADRIHALETDLAKEVARGDTWATSRDRLLAELAEEKRLHALTVDAAGKAAAAAQETIEAERKAAATARTMAHLWEQSGRYADLISTYWRGKAIGLLDREASSIARETISVAERDQAARRTSPSDQPHLET